MLSRMKRSPIRRNLVALPLLLLCLAYTPAAFALTSASMPGWADLDGHRVHVVASAPFKFFGVHLYTASLWTGDGDYSAAPWTQPVALHIEYKRNIPNTRLVKATAKEWERFGGYDTATFQRWLERLAAIWPDVKPGDSITSLVLPNGTTRFYSSKRFLGAVDDPRFGPAFLAIWLDPRTRNQALRLAIATDADYYRDN